MNIGCDKPTRRRRWEQVHKPCRTCSRGLHWWTRHKTFRICIPAAQWVRRSVSSDERVDRLLANGGGSGRGEAKAGKKGCGQTSQDAGIHSHSHGITLKGISQRSGGEGTISAGVHYITGGRGRGNGEGDPAADIFLHRDSDRNLEDRWLSSSFSRCGCHSRRIAERALR
jgi:hypothetical protein